MGEEVRQLHPPTGWFHAVSTRDGEAQMRAGQPFYAVNELEAQRGQVFEIRFGDGTWMLAQPEDLGWPK